MFLVPTSNFSYRNTKDFISRVRDGSENLYTFVSRSQPWNDDERPPNVQLSQKEERDTWDDMMLLRRILPSDIKEGIRRIPWVSGRVYDEFDDSENLDNKNFYVITEPDYDVYLCIGNNGGYESTVKPVSRQESVITEADGYKWKYMTTISNSLINKFLISDYIPIEEDIQIREAASPGSIQNIQIKNSGKDYGANRTVVNSNEIPVFIEGNGVNVATATANISTISGSISSITLATSGSGYFFGPNVEFPVAFRQITQDGTNQTAYGTAITNLNGEITGVRVIVPGSGYIGGLVTIIQSSAEGYAETNEEGKIVRSEIRVGREGTNFTRATGIIVSSNGTEGNLNVVLPPKGGFGINQLRQLGTHYALISLEVDTQDVLSLISFNEFRRLGLISNPLQFESTAFSDTTSFDSEGKLIGTPLSADTADAKSRVVLDSSNSGFVQNETIVGQTSGTMGMNTAVFSNNTLRFTLDDSFNSELGQQFDVGETVKGLESEQTAVVNQFFRPDTQKYSGSIYHINNIKPIIREGDQRIFVTFVLKY